jgi:hypothetical protein
MTGVYQHCVNPELDAVRIAEIELGEVVMKVRLAAIPSAPVARSRELAGNG